MTKGPFGARASRAPGAPSHARAGSVVPAALPAAVGIVALLALAGGPVVLAATLFVAQLALLLSWYGLLGVPGAAGGIVVTALAVATIDALLAGRDTEPALAPVAWVLGPLVVVAIVVQLVRRDGRTDVVASLMSTLSAAVLASGGALLVPAAGDLHGAARVAAGLAGALLAGAVGALPQVRARATAFGRFPEGRVRQLLGALGAALLGAAAGMVVAAVTALDIGPGGAIGAGAGVAALVARRFVAAGPGAAPGAKTIAGATLPLLLAGPPVYALGALLVR